MKTSVAIFIFNVTIASLVGFLTLHEWDTSNIHIRHTDGRESVITCLHGESLLDCANADFVITSSDRP